MKVRCFVVEPFEGDTRGHLVHDARHLGIESVTRIETADLWFYTELGTAGDGIHPASQASQASEGFDPNTVIDPVIQTGHFARTALPERLSDGRWVVETAKIPGVTDPTAEALEHVARSAGHGIRAASGKRFTISGPTDRSDVERLVKRLLANTVVERFSFGSIDAPFPDMSGDNNDVSVVEIRNLATDALLALSGQRGLALDLDQMLAVQRWFMEEQRDPTDAELETVAQTWSEHCAHTTFRADITFTDGRNVRPLMVQLRDCTDQIAAPWVRSAFVGNAGIVAFDELVDIAVKAETHNHPSAIEPFGGSNTGVGGVIRDVLGVSARPIAITDVLCFGPTDLDADVLPDGVLHPQRIRDGVVRGVADYGNKIGLPTVAGAIIHDPGFTANPLVFAGCVGVRPVGRDVGGASPGDRIVALGGRTGRDGIRGATFSSMEMDATTGDVAGASVQIGDPVTERLLIDLIDDAFAANLYTAITDCGAGGFSSAIGEMAEELGADVNLDPAPRKYAGLAPWEVWLSEAQERMVIAVSPDNMSELSLLCEQHQVECTDLGAFRSDGRLIVMAGDKRVVDLPASFLHNGRPQRHLTAEARPVPESTGGVRSPLDDTGRAESLLKLLADPSLRSNEDVVRGYDHEIGGRTIGRPYAGASDDGPADAAVIIPTGSLGRSGLAIGIGVNVCLGELDAKLMAEAVIDEAIRNVVATGADPDRICLLDNFSWGNPRRPSTLGQLVDAVEGCCDAAHRHRSPFVSGKDSLNNEYLGSDGQRHSVPPTLVITAFGVVPDASNRLTSDLKQAGNTLILLGRTRDELRGSRLDAVLGIDPVGALPGVDFSAPTRYRSFHRAAKDCLFVSAHDCSDGGLAVTLAEMAIAGRLGILADLATVHSDQAVAWFSESLSRIVVEVEPTSVAEVMARFGDDAVVVGTVTTQPEALGISLDALVRAWKGHV